MPPSLETRHMVFALFGAVALQVGVSLMALHHFGPTEEMSPTMVMFGFMVLPCGAAIIWLWYAAVWREVHGWAGLGFARLKRRWLLAAIALGLFSTPTVMLITKVAEPIFGPSAGSALPIVSGQAFAQPVYFLAMVLGIAVLSPIMEEIMFRGLLFGWLRRRFGLWHAGALAAIADAAIHFDPGALPGLFALFLLLAWSYEVSRNLWVPVIIHGIHNFVVLQMA